MNATVKTDQLRRVITSLLQHVNRCVPVPVPPCGRVRIGPKGLQLAGTDLCTWTAFTVPAAEAPTKAVVTAVNLQALADAMPGISSEDVAAHCGKPEGPLTFTGDTSVRLSPPEADLPDAPADLWA